MAQARGYGLLVGPDGQKETDWLKCNHCQYLVQIIPNQPIDNVGGHCRVCNHFICFNCEKKRQAGHACLPWEKNFERIEARERALASYGV